MFKAKPFVVSSSWGNVVAKPNKLSFRDFCSAVYNQANGFHNLYPFQYEMAEWFLKQKNTSLVLATRGIGKTLILTALTSLYRVYLDNNTTILIISYKAKSSETILNYISSIIKANKEFFSYIIDFRELKALSIKTKTFRGKGANIQTASLDSSIRGYHTDYIIFDDLVTDESSLSETYREKTKAYYEESKKVSNNIQFVGNITHPQDLHSELRLKDSIPRFEIFIDDDRIPDEFKPDLDKERDEGVSEASIMKNYYGILLPDESLPFYNIIETTADGLSFDGSTPYIFYDFSQGMKDLSCFSLCSLVGSKVYVYGLAYKESWDLFVDRTAELIRQVKGLRVFFESNTSGADMGSRKFNLLGINAVGVPTTTNKTAKIQALYPLRKDIIFINDGSLENKAYLDQVKGYSPSSRNSGDDAVDSLAMCLIQMGLINTK